MTNKLPIYVLFMLAIRSSDETETEAENEDKAEIFWAIVPT